jgi:aminopeptidase N
VQTLLRQLATTLGQYVPEAEAADARSAAADRLWELVQSAEAGSDNQLQFVKALALHARTEAQMDTVAGIHDGSVEVSGLDLSTDLKWELLTSLVAGGRAGEAEIAAAAEADRTATGALAAALARAAVPTAEAKAEAWKQVVDGTLSNTTQRQVLLGFQRVNDPALIAGYAEKYFEGIEGVWNSRSHEMAETAATLGFPSSQVSQETVDRATALVDAVKGSNAALARVVAECRDDMARALKARAAGE